MAKKLTTDPQPYREARRKAWGWHLVGVGQTFINSADGLIYMLKESPDYSDGLTNQEYQRFLKFAKLIRKMGVYMHKWGRNVTRSN